jgi:hypothetical protein
MTPPRAAVLRALLLALRIAALVAALIVPALTPAAVRAQFHVGFQDPGFEAEGTPNQARAAYEATTASDGSVVRIAVPWASVAPGGRTIPHGFKASEPDNPLYRWNSTDAAVRTAAQHHLRVLFEFLDAPVWARGRGPVKAFVSPGAWDPNPGEFAEFLHAVAVRYGGGFPDPLYPGRTLPRVSYWEPWNEPNIPRDFSAPDPLSAYRTLLDRAYAVLKAVHRDNVVVLGGLAPVSSVPGSIPPLDFGAQLLCLHRVGSTFAANRSCPQRARFDVFGIHPYSLAATPTKHAYNPGDVLIGDMDEVHALVKAADRLRTAVPRTRHPIWVTEFAWLTNPPNRQLGDPGPLAARYVAYSMYEMWKSGVSLVIWQQVLDEPYADFVGGGLCFNSGRPKLNLQAFAFPVVASVGGGRGLAWGRAPVSHPVSILVQRAAGHGWRTVAMLRTGADGIFLARFGARANGIYRARTSGGIASLAYDSRAIPPTRTHLGAVD